MLDRYVRDGFVTLPGLLAEDEFAPLLDFLQKPELFHRVGPLDYLGFTRPSDDLLGHLVRLERLVGTAESLLGGACYHYHSKLVRKPAARESPLAWHQDFASWYKDGCLLPSLVTCVIAITEASEVNGCFEIMRGSHRLGRLDRLPDGHDSYSYFSLSPQRLRAIESRFVKESMVMSPGDVFFFHCNTLHRSGPNQSNRDRVLFEITYNAIDNSPVFDGQSFHRYTPLRRVSDHSLRDQTYQSVIDIDNLIDIADDDDPGVGVFRRRFDPGLC